MQKFTSHTPFLTLFFRLLHFVYPSNLLFSVTFCLSSISFHIFLFFSYPFSYYRSPPPPRMTLVGIPPPPVYVFTPVDTFMNTARIPPECYKDTV
jgi:hypothetical protein